MFMCLNNLYPILILRRFSVEMHLRKQDIYGAMCTYDNFYYRHNLCKRIL